MFDLRIGRRFAFPSGERVISTARGDRQVTTRPLTERELRRLAKLDRRLARGRLRFGLLGFQAGALGGIGWTVLMRLFAPGFGTGQPSAPSADAAHPLLEQAVYGLSQSIGPLFAIGLVAAALFGVGFGFFAWSRAWPLLVNRHAFLASNAIAAGQYRPAVPPPSRGAPRR
jgi:hypothetical protein